MVAYSLVGMVGRASAANILGITVRELDKLYEIYELSEKLRNLPDPATSITWAREIKNLNKKLLTPTVLDTIIRRINDKEISNSKDVRKLRLVLKDPLARDGFLSPGGSIESALAKLELPLRTKQKGLLGEIEGINDVIRRYPWTTLASYKGDTAILRKIEETEKMLKDLRKTLSK